MLHISLSYDRTEFQVNMHLTGIFNAPKALKTEAKSWSKIATLNGYRAASASFNGLRVRPSAAFHSTRPLALRPSTTAAAVLGALNV